jgi:hypothetical protein
MSTLSLIVNCLIAAVAFTTLLVVLGLSSRVHVLQRAVDKARGLNLPAPGRAVLPFEIAEPNGERLTDASVRSGAMLVGFFAGGCTSCDRLKAQLLGDPPRLPLLAFVYGDAASEAAREIGTALADIARVVYFEDNSVHRAFGAFGFPALVRLENGAVAASGRKLADVGV